MQLLLGRYTASLVYSCVHIILASSEYYLSTELLRLLFDCCFDVCCLRLMACCQQQLC